MLRVSLSRNIVYFRRESLRGACVAAYGAAYRAAYRAAYGEAHREAYGAVCRGGLRGGLQAGLQAGLACSRVSLHDARRVFCDQCAGVVGD